MPATKVIFRRWPDGEVLALFPEVPATMNPYHCLSYANLGQHAAADPMLCVLATRPAAPHEYAALARELRARGYRLAVRRRHRAAYLDARRAALLLFREPNA